MPPRAQSWVNTEAHPAAAFPGESGCSELEKDADANNRRFPKDVRIRTRLGRNRAEFGARRPEFAQIRPNLAGRRLLYIFASDVPPGAGCQKSKHRRAAKRRGESERRIRVGIGRS